MFLHIFPVYSMDLIFLLIVNNVQFVETVILLVNELN